MNKLDELIPEAPKPPVVPVILYGEVESVDPLVITVDGDEEPLEIEPSSTVDGILPGDKVAMTLQNDELIVTGIIDGDVDYVEEFMDGIATAQDAIATLAETVGAPVYPPEAPDAPSVSDDRYVNPFGSWRSKVTASWAAVTEDTEGAPLAISRYELWGQPVPAGVPGLWRSLAASNGTSVSCQPFDIGSVWRFAVVAISASGQTSARGAYTQHTFSVDTTAPNQPAQPGASNYLGAVVASWTGLDAGGAAMPADFARCEVHVSTTSGFTPSSGTFRGTITPGGTYTISGLTVGTTYYIRLVAVDIAGNSSTPSAQRSASPVSISYADLDPTVETRLNAADGKTKNYYQTTAPSGGSYVVGDTWFDTDDSNRIYRWNGTSWAQVNLGSAAIADSAISTAKLAASSVDSSKLATAVNSAISAAQSAASTAQTAADAAQSAADDAQADADAAAAIASAAQSAASAAQSTADSAVSAASAAQTTANGKSKVTRSTSAPSGGGSAGDQWWRISGADVIGLWIYDGSSWVQQAIGSAAIGAGAVDATKLASAVNTAISTAQTTANNAASAAATAQSTADGKGKNYYQTTAPTGGTYTAFDTWFDTDDGHRMYRWNGSAWVAADFGTSALANNAVTSAKLVDDAVTAAKIATDAVTADAIAANAVGSTAILTNAITAAKIATDAVTADAIAGSAVGTAELASAAVTSAKIANLAVGTAQIADAAVVNAKIGSAAVGTANIQDLAVSGAKIADATIVNAKIADGTIQNAKIGSLNAGKITTGTLSADRIGASSITTSKLVVADLENLWPAPYFRGADAAVGGITKKLATDAGVPAGSPFPTCGLLSQRDHVPSNNDQSCRPGDKFYVEAQVCQDGTAVSSFRQGIMFLQANGTVISWLAPSNLPPASATTWVTYSGIVTAPANAAVIRPWVAIDGTTGVNTQGWYVTGVTIRRMASSELIVDGSIVTSKIAAGAITAGSAIIADGAITNAKIADATIANAKIANLDAAKITTGTLAADRIAAASITGAKIAAGTVAASNMIAGTITAASGIIADAAIGSAKIIDGSITDAKIANATIGNAKIANLDAAKITTGTLNAARIGAESITADKMSTTDVYTINNYAGPTDGNHTRMTPSGFAAWGPDPSDDNIRSFARFGNGLEFGFDPAAPTARVTGDGHSSFRSVSTDALQVGGSSLEQILSALPKGRLAYAQQESSVTGITTTETAVIELRAALEPDRLYEVGMIGIAARSSVAGDIIEWSIRVAYDGSAVNTSSTLIRSGVRQNLGPATLYVTVPPVTVDVSTAGQSGVREARFLLTAKRQSGTGTIDIWGSSGQPAQMKIRDEGAWRPATSTGILYQSTWAATSAINHTSSSSTTNPYWWSIGSNNVGALEWSQLLFAGNAIAGETGKTIAQATTGATISRAEVLVDMLDGEYYRVSDERQYAFSRPVRVTPSTNTSSNPSTSWSYATSGAFKPPQAQWVDVTSLWSTATRSVYLDFEPCDAGRAVVATGSREAVKVRLSYTR